MIIVCHCQQLTSTNPLEANLVCFRNTDIDLRLKVGKFINSVIIKSLIYLGGYHIFCLYLWMYITKGVVACLFTNWSDFSETLQGQEQYCPLGHIFCFALLMIFTGVTALDVAKLLPFTMYFVQMFSIKR